MSVWADKVTVACDQCPKTASYANPGRHSLTIVMTKALKDGWYLPRNGKTLCPDCIRKLITQQGMKPFDKWHTPETKAAVAQLDQLPAPPKLWED